MTDFLTFLNTADQQTLKKVPGVSNKLAENIITSRPFDYVDDCLLVPGMGKNLLSRMQEYVQAQGDETENRAMIPLQEEAPLALVEKGRSDQESADRQESFFSRMGHAFSNFLRALLKLIIVAALIGAIGALLYYSIPYFNKMLIAPVEQNSAQIDRLETEIIALQTQLAETRSRADSLENTVEMQTLSIQKLEEMQASLETQLESNHDKVLVELEHEIIMTRALDILSRARLYLAQSNFGMAKVDMQSARGLLFNLQSDADDDTLSQAIARLDLALGNLPAFPVVAAADLEIAWQILMTGESFVPATLTPTVIASATFTPTPAPPPSVQTTSTP